MLEPVHSSCSYHAARTTGHKLRASAVFFSTPCADVRLDSLCTPLRPHGLNAYNAGPLPTTGNGDELWGTTLSPDDSQTFAIPVSQV